MTVTTRQNLANRYRTDSATPGAAEAFSDENLIRRIALKVKFKVRAAWCAMCNYAKTVP